MGNEKEKQERWEDNLYPRTVHLRPTSGLIEEQGDFVYHRNLVFTTTEVCLVLLVSDSTGCKKIHSGFNEP